MLLLLFLFALPLKTLAQCSNNGYAQCGGFHWTGATCCPLGFVCKKSNDYYSQCLPGTAFPTLSPTNYPTGPTVPPGVPSQSPTKRPTAAPTITCTNGLYAQCGGVGFTGVKCCPNGAWCEPNSPTYHQCVIGDAPTTAPTVAPTEPPTTPEPTVPPGSPSRSPTPKPTHRPTTRAPTTSPTVTCTNGLYTQCGGIGFSGNTCCPNGAWCQPSGSTYSQCVVGEAPTPPPTDAPSGAPTTTEPTVPPGAPSRSPTTKAPTTSPTVTCVNAVFAQCGGSGFSGNTCCPNGSWCQPSSQWYSQCVIGQAIEYMTLSVDLNVVVQETTTTSPTTASPTTAPPTTASPTTTSNSSDLALILGLTGGGLVVSGVAIWWLIGGRRRQYEGIK